MSKITFEIFGTTAELSAFTFDDGHQMTFEFGKDLEGLVSISGIVSPLRSGTCKFDVRLIDHGEHQPILILRDKVIRLPKLIKTAGKLRPATCTDEYTRDISIRERRLSEKVEALEMQIKAIESKISRTIF